MKTITKIKYSTFDLNSMKNIKKIKYSTFDVVLVIFLGLVCITCILPFVNLLAISFSGSTAVAAGKVGLIPKDFTLSSYEFVLSGGKFLRAMMVSIERVIIGTGINLLLMVLTAYPLSKGTKKLAGRKYYMLFFVITMLIGGGMIPTYLVVSNLGLKDTIWALILPGALPVYSMIILMNFIRELPAEMEEAAEIDGATPLQILIRVILPVLKPALATVGLFCIVGHWNDWFSGMIYMSNPDNYPLQTYLQSLLQNFDQLLLSDNTHDIQSLLSKMNARTGRAAQLFLGSIPIILIYPFLQKNFTKGLVLGSVKG
ncbi:carbohydrate ABC transporter permease [Neobacillus drentensis]|uniref:carbohydrate ABC transporter permease n=1 Tax=Neobacillus drentensis TaxID=220684 RepID=UPI001F36D7C8|nr:carbohydrate ABC transporter permease [Neobacillus drentensis]ULT58720.1 carbohydrate ABC transporter permease [Neobacillus drentensis]